MVLASAGILKLQHFTKSFCIIPGNLLPLADSVPMPCQDKVKRGCLCSRDPLGSVLSVGGPFPSLFTTLQLLSANGVEWWCPAGRAFCWPLGRVQAAPWGHRPGRMECCAFHQQSNNLPFQLPKGPSLAKGSRRQTRRVILCVP